MATKKQGVLDFFVAAAKSQKLTQKFLDVYYKKGATAADLKKWFKDNGYDGATTADCEKMLETLKIAGGTLPCTFNTKY